MTDRLPEDPAAEPSSSAGSASTPDDGSVLLSAEGEGSPVAVEPGFPDPPAVEELVIAPGVERLGRPSGTSQRIPETMLGPRPSAVFLTVVSIITLVADVGTKLWAEQKLAEYPGHITVLENHLMFVLAKNKGGAWGLLQGESENVRRPFFLLVSVAAIAFIVTLYRRLHPSQHALRWGLPLVLGGALGNVFDRIRYGYVIDFIDYRAEWVKRMNELVGKYVPKHFVTDHWPTFNVADIAICIGVGLMAVDMITARRVRTKSVPLADVPITDVPTVEDPLAEGSTTESPLAETEATPETPRDS
jgi:signal peptidase II